MALTNGIQNIDGVDPYMDVLLEADIREEACLGVTGVVANMEQTANYYGTIWRQELIKYYPLFTVSDLVHAIKSAESGSNATAEEDNMWVLAENMTIDAATEADLHVIRNNITLVNTIFCA